MARYAIYAVPDSSLIRQRAAEWYTAHPDITVSARRYGFHGTLKAPFRLADGADEAGLVARVARFAAAYEPVVIPALRVATLGEFRALIPGAASPALDALAADVVRDLDDLRAPLTDADRVRRRPESLSERQRDLLEAWGYPYVLDEFRFHLTLTDPVPSGRADEIDRELATHFADVEGTDATLSSLAIFIERAPGKAFQTHSAHPLGRGPRSPEATP